MIHIFHISCFIGWFNCKFIVMFCWTFLALSIGEKRVRLHLYGCVHILFFFIFYFLAFKLVALSDDSIINLQRCFFEFFLLYQREKNDLAYIYMVVYIFSFLAFKLLVVFSMLYRESYWFLLWLVKEYNQLQFFELMLAVLCL